MSYNPDNSDFDMLVRHICSCLNSTLSVALLQHLCLLSRATLQATGPLQCVLFACEWVGQPKYSLFLSSTQCPLPQQDSQTWIGQGVMGSCVSHWWLTTTAGAPGCLLRAPSDRSTYSFPDSGCILFLNKTGGLLTSEWVNSLIVNILN